MSVVRFQRHTPCACGSFRPLVDCCLPWEEAFRRTVSRLAAFAATAAVRRLEARAASVFWNTETPAQTAHRRSAGAASCFVEWFLHDHVAPKRTGPLLGEFADMAGGLSLREEQVVFAMLLTPMRAFEIMEAPGPRGAPVKDLLGGAECTVGPQGLPEGLIRSDVCIGRLLPVGRLRRPGIGVLRLPPGSGGELLAYLRATYRLSQPGRHVSLEDYVDGATHLYHHFFLDRGREMGGRAHRTCRWIPFRVGEARYLGSDTVRIRAMLERQPLLDRIEETETGTRYVWVDQASGTALGTIRVWGDEILARAETGDDLARLEEFLATCLRGLVRRADPDPLAVPPESPAGSARTESGSAGLVFIRRMLERWPDLPHALLSDRTPRDLCRSEAGREQVAQLLVGVERDLARQKRLGRAWDDAGPLWERLSLPPPVRPRGAGSAERATPVSGRESASATKR